jgi:uncharacterized protein YndB with AHSA1/START domain
VAEELSFAHNIVIDREPKAVWHALVDPDERNKYVCTTNQTDLRPQGAFIEEYAYGPTRAGIFLVVDPPWRLVQENFVFDRGRSHRYYNSFTFRTHESSGTDVHLRVEGFRDNDSENWLRESMFVGWERELRVLKAYVETGVDIRPEVWKGVLMGLRFVSAAGAGGVRIIDVIKGSPAADAGLVTGDVIEAVDGITVADFLAFRNRISAYEPYQTAEFTVRRDGATTPVGITFGSAIG